MILAYSFATARRVFVQSRRDYKTLLFVMLMPSIVIILLRYSFDGKLEAFESFAPLLLGIIPFLIMFLVTFSAMLREHTSGTMSRLMTLPTSRLAIVLGYALTFSLIGIVQVLIMSFVTLGILDVRVLGGAIPLLIIAVAAVFLGTAFGLLISAFARNESQAMQLIVFVLIPQILICGLFVAREQMVILLQIISAIVPLAYVVDAMRELAVEPEWTMSLTQNLIAIFCFGVIALVFSSLTIRRSE